MSKDLTDALREMMQDNNPPSAPPAPKPRGAAPYATGASLLSGQPTGGGGGGGGGDGGDGGNQGGGSGNLAEQNYAARSWWPQLTGSSSDGLIWARTRPIRSITFKDSGGNTVIHSYAQPPS